MTKKTLPRLYVVTNRHQTRERSLQTVLQETLNAGTAFVQLREKDIPTRHLLALAQDLLPKVRQHHAFLLINDRGDIAKHIGADGVHLRSNSLPIPQMRQFLGPQALIGKSTHSLQDVLIAEVEGADFLVLGPIYDTPSKKTYGPPLGLGVLEQACQQSTLPIYAIGGITPERVREVQQAGAYGVAVISAILESTSIPSATRQFLQALQNS
ncbi:MAG: putative thiamine-phosphate synthase [Nitrospirales bacterium]|nr:MAG: putative thiamine-phosphate synthase [Nitrospirales bacterium]